MAIIPRERLHVAHVVCTDAFAGVERYVATLASAQAGLGWNVEVIGGSPERMPAALSGVSISWHPGATWPAAARRLARQRELDVVHVHMTAAEVAGVVTLPLLRTPLIATRHFARRRGSHLGGRLARRIIGRALAGQIAISEVVAAEAEGYTRVIYTGTPDVDAPDPATRAREVLVLQRLEPEKRTDLALRVWQESGLGERGWRLRIAGDGSQAETLRRMADELGVGGSTEFLGYRDDATELMRRAAILLAPSPNDGLGLTVIEAMAAALPVVAARAKGHLETVGACPGAVFFDVDDPAGAGSRLRELAEDDLARHGYGDALQHVQRKQFSTAQQVRETEKFYREVLAARGGRMRQVSPPPS